MVTGIGLGWPLWSFAKQPACAGVIKKTLGWRTSVTISLALF